jgi:hypothetical protein
MTTSALPKIASRIGSKMEQFIFSRFDRLMRFRKACWSNGRKSEYLAQVASPALER